MSHGSPEVLSGTRAPRAVRLEQARAAEPKPVAAVAASEFNTYVSRDRRYRVQITAPQKMLLADGRHQSGGKMIVAQFEDNVYRNNHRDPEVRKLIDEELQRNVYFGEFGNAMAHFWLASDQNAKTEKARIANALATLKSLPKAAVDQFIGELAQSEMADHELPTPKA